MCVTWSKVWSSLTMDFVSFIANCSNESIAIMLLSLLLFENKSFEAVVRKSYEKYTSLRIKFLKATDFLMFHNVEKYNFYKSIKV